MADSCCGGLTVAEFDGLFDAEETGVRENDDDAEGNVGDEAGLEAVERVEEVAEVGVEEEDVVEDVVDVRDRLLPEEEFTVDNCSWINIMWSPSRIVKFNGAFPDRKSTT